MKSNTLKILFTLAMLSVFGVLSTSADSELAERITTLEHELVASKLDIINLKKTNVDYLEILLENGLGDYAKYSEQDREKEEEHLARLKQQLETQSKSIGKVLIEKKEKEVKRFDIDFEGGTEKDLVKALADVVGPDANVVTLADDSSSDHKIPAFKLKSVTVDNIFNMLSNFETRNGRYPRWDKVEGIWFYTGATRNIRHSREDQLAFWTHKLDEILENYPIESVTTALQTALDLREFSQPTKVRFHEDTNLLIVNGTREAIQIVDQVIGKLR